MLYAQVGPSDNICRSRVARRYTFRYIYIYTYICSCEYIYIHVCVYICIGCLWFIFLFHHIDIVSILLSIMFFYRSISKRKEKERDIRKKKKEEKTLDSTREESSWFHWRLVSPFQRSEINVFLNATRRKPALRGVDDPLVVVKRGQPIARKLDKSKPNVARF